MAKDYAQLAKRISTYTTNGLLSAVVLVAGLAFACQVLVWWADDPADSPAAQTTAIADGPDNPAKMHVLEFGSQPWSLASRSISGNRQSVGDALREICREAVVAANPNPEEPGPAQQRLLQRLRQCEPVEEQPGKWRLYQLDGPFPMVAGVDTSRQQQESVVTWGLAVPSSEGPWTLYALRRAKGVDGVPNGASAVPVPPGSYTTMSVAVKDGPAMVTFRGSQPAEMHTARTWTKFYDKWFKDNGWQATSVWRENGSASHARYAAPPDSPTASVDVSFDSDAEGCFAGLLMITPKAEHPASETKQ